MPFERRIDQPEHLSNWKKNYLTASNRPQRKVEERKKRQTPFSIGSKLNGQI
jgi:hypothetical protein